MNESGKPTRAMIEDLGFAINAIFDRKAAWHAVLDEGGSLSAANKAAHNVCLAQRHLAKVALPFFATVQPLITDADNKVWGVRTWDFGRMADAVCYGHLVNMKGAMADD